MIKNILSFKIFFSETIEKLIYYNFIKRLGQTKSENMTIKSIYCSHSIEIKLFVFASNFEKGSL